MLAQGSRAGERDTDAMQNLTVLSPGTSPSGGDPEEAGREGPSPVHQHLLDTSGSGEGPDCPFETLKRGQLQEGL